MIDFLKENKQFMLLLIIWVAAGMVLKESALLLIPAGLVLLKKKQRYTELLISVFLLLFLSDNRHEAFEFSGYVKDIAVLMLSIFVIADPKQFKPRNTLYFYFVPFLILSFLLSARNPEPMVSFQKILSFALMLVFIPDYFTRELALDGRKFLRFFIFFASLLLLIGLIFIVVLNDWAYLAGRYNGLLGNPNGIGIFCTMFVMTIVLAMYHYKDLFSKNELRFLIFVIGASVLLCGSRNSIFSIIILLTLGRFFKTSYWVAFMLMIASIILFQTISSNLPAILNSLGLGTYLRTEHLDDGSGRLIAWAFAWETIQKEHLMLFGYGFNYEVWLFYENRYWLSNLGHQGGVHSTYLALWLNTGLVGLVLYMFALLRTFIKTLAVNYLTIPCLLTILFSISFEAWFQASLNPFTIVALLNITLLAYVKPATEEQTAVSVL
jgi:O-antigen ligase